jgi:Oxidoreductase family, NAD-binding Rossmann fold
MNFLVVGFGAIGCRHAQSLLEVEGDNTFIIVEPEESVFESNLIRIGATSMKNKFKYLNSIDLIHHEIDFAVLATSSQPRCEIMKDLIKTGVKKFLVEKVVFQSEDQFDEVINLIQSNNVVARCNFVNRYFSNYSIIKRSFNPSYKFTMVVSGGEFGLGCNALHYIDLFEYLTSEVPKLIFYKIEETTSGNRRGKIYKEFVGILHWQTESGHQLIINSDSKRNGGIEINVQQGGTYHVLNEQSYKHFTFDDVNGFSEEPFDIKGTSKLTARIFTDIVNNRCQLPTIQETKSIHISFFEAINRTLGLANGINCPIT